MIACNFSNKKASQIVNEILQIKDVDTSIRNNDGDTAFMLACKNKNYKVVKLLMEYSNNIDINEKNNDGNTALIYACKKYFLQNINMTLIKFLLSHPYIDIYIENNNGETAFSIASQYKNKDIIDLLEKYHNKKQRK